jgi:hypothetical protein
VPCRSRAPRAASQGDAGLRCSERIACLPQESKVVRKKEYVTLGPSRFHFAARHDMENSVLLGKPDKSRSHGNDVVLERK